MCIDDSCKRNMAMKGRQKNESFREWKKNVICFCINSYPINMATNMPANSRETCIIVLIFCFDLISFLVFIALRIKKPGTQACSRPITSICFFSKKESALGRSPCTGYIFRRIPESGHVPQTVLRQVYIRWLAWQTGNALRSSLVLTRRRSTNRDKADV